MTALTLWSGCGGGSSSTDQTSSPNGASGPPGTAQTSPTEHRDLSRTIPVASLSRVEFAKRMEAICARGRLRGLEYKPASDPNQSERDAVAAGIQNGLLPALQKAIDEIYELGAPKEERAQTERLATALQRAVDTAEEKEVGSFERLEPLLGPAGKVAREEKLESCVYS